MFTRFFERFNEKGEKEEIAISSYGFVWRIENEIVKSGCVENIDEDIASLIDIGFIEVENL